MPLAPGALQSTSVEVPIRLGNRVLGALSFGSCAPQTRWSAEHSAQMWRIAGIFAHALQRKRSDEQIEDALSFERLLVQLSSLVSRAPPADMLGAQDACLRQLAKSLQLDHIALLEFSTTTGEPLAIGQHGEGPRFSPSPELVELLRLGDVLRLTRPLGDGAPGQPLLVLPLAVHGAPLCALCAAPSAGVQPDALDRLTSRLGLAGSILATAWARGKALEMPLRTEPIYVRRPAAPELPFAGVIGHSDALRYVLFKVHQVAHTNVTTLLLGETGTGKGLISRAIHERSGRRVRPLVSLNCAALPAGLVEAELFGHERGAYTGAHRSQRGRFELADGSTLLLDEIGDLPLELQPKLLRVLQDGEFERVGGSRTLRVDVRIIAATNRNLEEEVRRGRFREDLYYRLNVFPITLPALRERLDDIPALVEHLLARLGRELGKTVDRVPRGVMQVLQAYDWPGNIRELESVLTRAVVLATDATLRLAERLGSESAGSAPSLRLVEVERSHISQVLCRYQWHIEGPTGAAHALGMNPSTLRGRMRKLEIHRPK